MVDRGSTLAAGDYLNVNDYLRSKNGAYMALMQTDGNFVVYRGMPGVGGTPIWATNTSRSGACFATMQVDGNFVLYDGVPHRQGAPFWASNTAVSTRGAYFLLMQDDGNLVIYRGSPTWATNTAR